MLTAEERRVYRLRYYALILCRIGSALIIFISPIIAIVASFVFDILDGINASRGGIKKHTYHLLDKALDIFWYTVSIVFVLISHPQMPYVKILIFLYLWRLFGFLLFIVFKWRSLFVFFPNIYENILILVLFSYFISGLSFLVESPIFEVLFLVLSFMKIGQEIVMHSAKYSTTEKILKMKMYWVDE